jgi:hypothetical protein
MLYDTADDDRETLLAHERRSAVDAEGPGAEKGRQTL